MLISSPEYLEVELPAIEQLKSLGYGYSPGEMLDAERDSYKNPILAGRLKAKVQVTEHALRKEIDIRLARDPIYYQSLRERLEAIVTAIKEKRIAGAHDLLELLKLRQEMQNREERGQQELPLTPRQLPFFNQLAVSMGTGATSQGGAVRFSEARAIYTANLPAAQKEQLIKLTEAVWETIEEAAVIDWQRGYCAIAKNKPMHLKPH